MRIYLIINIVCILYVYFIQITYANDVLFNEIMWMGSSMSTADEWVELYNPTDEIINLSGYILLGAKSGTGIFTFKDNHIIQPHGFFLISNYGLNDAKTILNIQPNIVDTAVSISNTNLNLKLINPEGVIIDEVTSICSGENNTIKKSMIKINTGSSVDCINWSSSSISVNIKNTDTNKASPMAYNIDFNTGNTIDNNTNNINNESTNIIFNNPPVAIIDLQSGTQTSSILNLKTNVTGINSYDIDGDSIKCDWDYGNGYIVQNNCNPTYYTYSGIGIYTMVLTVTDSKGLSSSSSIIFTVYDTPVYSNSIRINEVYPNPSGKDIDEWIELYNFSYQNINLNNWYLQVNSNTKKILNGDIAPNDYKVFSKADLNFTISNYSGVYIKLYNPNNELVDSFIFNTNVPDNLSMSYISGAIILTHSTKKLENIFYNNAPQAIILLQSPGKSFGFNSLSVNPISASVDIDNDTIYCDWDFGDGYVVKNNCNPSSHTYSAGNYKLQLHVRDFFGAISETYIDINVYQSNFNNGGSQNISKKIEYQMLYCPTYNSGSLFIEEVNIDDSKSEYFILYNSGNDIIDLSCLIFFDSKKYKTFNSSITLFPMQSIKIFAKDLKLNFYQTKESMFEIYNAKNQLIACYKIYPKQKNTNIISENCYNYESGSIVILNINNDNDKDEYFTIKNMINTGIDLSCLIFSDGKRKKSFSGIFILQPNEYINIKTKDIGLNFLQKKDNELFIYNVQNELISYFYKKHTAKDKNKKDYCTSYNSGSISIIDFDFSKDKDEYFVIQNNSNEDIDLSCLIFFNNKKYKSFNSSIIIPINNTYTVLAKDIGLNFLQKKDNELFIYNVQNELISYYFFKYEKLSKQRSKKQTFDYETQCLNINKINVIDFYPDTKDFLFYNNNDTDIDLRCIKIQYKNKVHKTDHLILLANTGTIVHAKYLNIRPAKTSGSIILIDHYNNILSGYSWLNKRSKKDKNIFYVNGETAILKKMKSGTKIYMKNVEVITSKGDISKNNVIIQGKYGRYKLKLKKKQYLMRGDIINIYGSIAREKGNIYIKSDYIKLNNNFLATKNIKNINALTDININTIKRIYKYIVGNSYKNKVILSFDLHNKLYNDVYIEGQVCGSQKTYIDICLITGEKVVMKNKYKLKIKKGDSIYMAGIVSKYGKKNIIIPHTHLSINIYPKWKKENEILIAKYKEYIKQKSQMSITDKILAIIYDDIDKTRYYFANLFM